MNRPSLFTCKFAVFLIFLCQSVYGQQTISRTNEKVIMESGRQTVSDYTKYMELLAQETDKDVIALYKAELMKTVQRDSVNVYNDLIPKEDRPKNVQENIDRLTTYLDDIGTRYLDGVKIVYTNITPSKVFIDPVRSRLFIKVTADRKIDGVYYNKNQKKQNTSEEKIDFYVKVQLKGSGTPESKIYSVFIHEDNERQFTPIKVVEKTAPIIFNNVKKDTTYKRATEHSLTWQGGEIFERLRLDLYKQTSVGAVRVMAIDTGYVNDNKIRFPLKKVKPGKRNKYFYQITKLSSEEQPIKSETFYVKRKIPLIAQVGVPLLLVGGVTYLIISQQPAKKDPVLPGPTDPE